MPLPCGALAAHPNPSIGSTIASRPAGCAASTCARWAARSPERRGGSGELSCRTVWVGKKRRVSFAKRAGGGRRGALARPARARGRTPRRAARRRLRARGRRLWRARDARRSAGPGEPLVLAVGGLVASGKSTVAKAVAHRTRRRASSPTACARRCSSRGPEGVVHELVWDSLDASRSASTRACSRAPGRARERALGGARRLLPERGAPARGRRARRAPRRAFRVRATATRRAEDDRGAAPPARCARRRRSVCHRERARARWQAARRRRGPARCSASTRACPRRPGSRALGLAFEAMSVRRSRARSPSTAGTRCSARRTGRRRTAGASRRCSTPRARRARASCPSRRRRLRPRLAAPPRPLGQGVASGARQVASGPCTSSARSTHGATSSCWWHTSSTPRTRAASCRWTAPSRRSSASRAPACRRAGLRHRPDTGPCRARAPRAARPASPVSARSSSPTR